MMEKKNQELYLISVIKKKYWYGRCSEDIKQMIKSLPKSHDGYLTQLVNIPEISDNKYFWKIQYISLGVNKILTGIILKSEINNEEFLIEFASTKEGNSPFCFGVLGISNKDKITHIGFINKQTYLSKIPDFHPILAYFPNFSNTTVFTVPENIKRELNKMTNTNTEISRFVDLGSVIPDISMSWNKVSLFLGIIPFKDQVINESKTLSFVPVTELKLTTKTISDGLLLAIIAKLDVFDII